MTAWRRGRGACALLFAAFAACRGADEATSPPIHSHVALFPVDTSALHGDAAAAADPIIAAVLEQCLDGRLSYRLRDAIEAECGAGSTTLLPHPFANDLDDAWDQEPTPQLAIVTSVKPRSATHDGRVGGTVVGTLGWFMIGIPGYVIDDYDEFAPVELEITLYEGVERSDRNLGAFEVGNEAVATDFIDRNGVAFVPYVLTILIPPHFLSAMSHDDPAEMAELLLQKIATTAARGISARIHSWEVPTREAEPPTAPTPTAPIKGG